MKGVVYYYSNTGNTRLACEALQSGLRNAEIRLVDISGADSSGLRDSAVAGFAFSTDFWGVPALMERFIESIPSQDNKPAFLLNTYAGLSGRILLTAEKLLRAKGFVVCGGYSLHMPQGYPPLIASGMLSEKSPGASELKGFRAFISSVDALCTVIQAGKKITGTGIKPGFMNSLVPSAPRTKARDEMGEKFVDENACTRCGICVGSCKYGAIDMPDLPVFDMSKCMGCWSCFNLCPESAVYTAKLKGKAQYRAPEGLRDKVMSIVK